MTINLAASLALPLHGQSQDLSLNTLEIAKRKKKMHSQKIQDTTTGMEQKGLDQKSKRRGLKRLKEQEFKV